MYFFKNVQVDELNSGNEITKKTRRKGLKECCEKQRKRIPPPHESLAVRGSQERLESVEMFARSTNNHTAQYF